MKPPRRAVFDVHLTVELEVDALEAKRLTKGRSVLDGTLENTLTAMLDDEITSAAHGTRIVDVTGVDARFVELERACRKCGCTDGNACEGGCSWVADDLCSACVPKRRTGT